MKNTIVAVIVTISILMCCAWALSMSSEYGPGPVVRQSAWPPGLADVLNSHKRVYGYWIGFTKDYIYYTGDTAEFNAFVRKLSAVKGSPITVTLHAGRGVTTRLEEEDPHRISFDWKVSVVQESIRSPHVTVTVDVWLGGNVQLERMKVPDAMTLRSGGEVERFVSSHAHRSR